MRRSNNSGVVSLNIITIAISISIGGGVTVAILVRAVDVVVNVVVQ